MALKIALAAKSPFALERARNDLVMAHEGKCLVYGFRNPCEVHMVPDTVVKLISETDWRRGSYIREDFDQMFAVGPEPLGIDFMLELQECLKGSCVPEEWKWQKWVSQNLQFGTKVFDVSLVPDGGYPINREDGWKPMRWAEREADGSV